MTVPLRIKEFAVGEPNRLLWVRWWDNPQRADGAQSHSPSICVQLDYLAPDIDLTDLRGRSPRDLVKGMNGRSPFGGEFVRIDAGFIPGLKIGDVYRDGLRVGRLPFERREFVFLSGTTDLFLKAANLDSPVPRPRWYTEGRAWPVLSKTAYPRGERFGGAYLLLLRNADSEITLHLPSPEVFRAFYAPSTQFARALLSGPWGEMMDAVVNPSPERTRWLDGRSQLGLRMGVRVEDARFAHLIVNDPIGRRAANAIDTRIRASKDAQRNIDPAKRFVPLCVDLPFHWVDELRLLVEGFTPYPGEKDHFVGLTVRRWNWPFQAFPIDYWRDNDAYEGLTKMVREGPKPFATVIASSLAERNGAVETNPSHDALARLMREVVATEGAELCEAPEPERIEKPESTTWTGGRVPRTAEEPSDVSFSTPISGGAATPVEAQATGREKGIHQFDAVADMLDRANEAGIIGPWNDVCAPGRMATAVGRWQAWTFPNEHKPRRSGLRWDLLSRPSRQEALEQKRGALVVRTSVDDQPVLVIVTELRPDPKGEGKRENYCSATVLFAGPHEVVIANLLHLCVARAGRWPDPLDAAWQVNGVIAASKWRHCWSGPDKSLLGRTSFENSLRDLGFAI